MCNIKNNLSCPVDCKYCMVIHTDRFDDWKNGKNKNRYGVNKTALFINRGLHERPLSELEIEKDFIKGEFISLNTNNDPFMKSQREDIKYITSLYEEGYRYKLLNLVSKIPIHHNKGFMDSLKNVPNLLVTYSVTGLDGIEKTKSIERIKSIVELKKRGINTHVLIHPYIHGLTHLDEVLKQLKKAGINTVTVKGFRYNKKMESWFKPLVPSEILDEYSSKENEEVLLGKKYIIQLLEKYEIKNIESLSAFNIKYADLSNRLNQQEAIEIVSKIKNEVVFSTSGKKEDVVKKMIERRI